MEQSFYIYKGSNKVDSFYLNELPIKFNFDGTEKVLPLRMFPQRKNSCIYFKTEKEALDYIAYALVSINNDDRFSSEVKKSLIKYLVSFKVSV
jgi:hypothetical protein